MYEIEQFSKGHFHTTEGNYDASVMDTDSEGVWLIPYDETEVMFVKWDDVTGFAQDVYGSYELDQEIRRAYYDNR